MVTSSQPYVSIITSCSVNPSFQRRSQDGRTVAGTEAIIDRLWERGERHFDLYMLHDDDIVKLADASDVVLPEYFSLVDILRDINVDTAAQTILSWFPAELRARCIRGISPIRSFATNIPDISSLEDQKREQACRAMLNCVQIAHQLGASCVEIVGGYSFRRETNPTRVLAGPNTRQLKLASLRTSLRSLSTELKKLQTNTGLALEIEPGPSYLINSVSVAGEILSDFHDDEYIGLNVDIGHMLLLENGGEDCLATLRKPHFQRKIMHFHVSDHSVSHFADLPIGAIHGQNEIAKYAELLPGCSNRYFSNTIAVEQEAAHSIDEALRSARLVRSWFGLASTQNVLPTNIGIMTPSIGAVMFVDIISSTEICRQLKRENLIKSIPEFLCAYVNSAQQCINRYHGYFDKFTGDGVVAFFLKDASATAQGVIGRALACANELRNSFSDFIWNTVSRGARAANDQSAPEYRGIRIGIAYGDEFEFGTMNDGPSPQITGVGTTVIEAARILSWCRPNTILVNHELAQQGTKGFFEEFIPEDKHEIKLKGLDDSPRTLYLYKG